MPPERHHTTITLKLISKMMIFDDLIISDVLSLCARCAVRCAGDLSSDLSDCQGDLSDGFGKKKFFANFKVMYLRSQRELGKKYKYKSR